MITRRISYLRIKSKCSRRPSRCLQIENVYEVRSVPMRCDFPFCLFYSRLLYSCSIWLFFYFVCFITKIHNMMLSCMSKRVKYVLYDDACVENIYFERQTVLCAIEKTQQWNHFLFTVAVGCVLNNFLVE